MANSNRIKRAELIAEVATRAQAEKSRSQAQGDPAPAPLSGRRYLKGVARPGKAGLETLAAYLGVSVPWLRGNLLSKQGGMEFEVSEPALLCAICGGALQTGPEGTVAAPADGTELEGEGTLRVWPCIRCCRGS
jgi:hypothetical protein